MKVRELATVIANMSAMAASLGQLAGSAHTVNTDGEKVVTIAADSVMSTSERLIVCCNKLGELIPDVEIELKGDDDASHCNDQ